MVRVADDAARKTYAGKCIFVRTGVEKLLLKNVAGGAYVLDGGNTGRGGAMTSMTRRASRCARVPPNRERFMMDARGIESELIRWNLVLFHVVRVRVTIRAGLGDVHGINGRLGIVRRANAVRRVAVRADRHVHVTFRQELPVHAGSVLAKLVRA